MKEEKDIIQSFVKIRCKCTNNGYHLYDIARWLREEKNILLSVYSNASGYLWSTMDAIGGTDRDWSEYDGPNDGGCWDAYEEALEAGIWHCYYKLVN